MQKSCLRRLKQQRKQLAEGCAGWQLQQQTRDLHELHGEDEQEHEHAGRDRPFNPAVTRRIKRAFRHVVFVRRPEYDYASIDHQLRYAITRQQREWQYNPHRVCWFRAGVDQQTDRANGGPGGGKAVDIGDIALFPQQPGAAKRIDDQQRFISE